MEHSFTQTIKAVLQKHFGAQADELFERSLLLQYLNLKTRSANRGSKSRSSFANLYALYVLAEDYLKGGFDKTGNYSKYEGAVFSRLFQRQRELPFGSKLQNHALNHRLNEEFKKFFPTGEFTPIVRDVQTNRYWLNRNLLRLRIRRKDCDLAATIVEIVNEYITTKSLFLRAVPVKLHSIAVGVTQVNRLAHAMIGRAVNLNARREQAAQRVGELGAGGIENRQMIQAGRVARGRRTAVAFPSIQADVVMIAAGGNKRRLRPEALREFKAQHVTVKPQRALQVGHFEMHVADADAGSDCVGIFVGIHG